MQFGWLVAAEAMGFCSLVKSDERFVSPTFVSVMSNSSCYVPTVRPYGFRLDEAFAAMGPTEIKVTEPKLVSYKSKFLSRHLRLQYFEVVKIVC
jgi:hypothetical protein